MRILRLRSLRFLGLVCLLLGSTQSEFLKDVKDVEWTLELPESKIEKGNGVVYTPNGQYLLVTTAEGRFHSIAMAAGGPPRAANIRSLEPPADTLACTSEPVPLQSDPSVAVYAVHAPTISYVIAVRIADAEVVWQVQIPGWIAGSPVEGSDGTLYVTHNSIVTTTTTGQVSVIRNQQIAATLPTRAFTSTPFAPPAVVSRPAGDVLVFGEAREGGLSQFGALYALTWSREHAERDGMGVQSYTFRRLPTTVRSGATAPVLADDVRIYLGTQGSLVVGWDQGAQNSLLEANNQVTLYPWGSLMELDPQNYFSPIPATPVLSTDQTQLFVVGAGPEVAASDLVQGFKLWEDSTLETPVRARAVYQDSTEDPVVYFMESSGTIHQKEPDTGRTIWSFDLDNNVEGEFTVAPGGNLLVAGDTDGTLRAITVAEFETQRPTPAPKGIAPPPPPPPPPPTQAPVRQPTEAPVTKGGGLRATFAPVVVPIPNGTPSQVVAPTVPTPVLPMITLRPTSVDERTALQEDRFSFGLIPTISAAIGVVVLCCLMCIVMILRLRLSRRKKARDLTTKADEETARRLEAEQLAYEQECAQNEHELLDALAVGTPVAATKAVAEQGVSETKSWDTESVTPGTQASTSMPNDDSDQSRSFGFEVSVDNPSIGAHSTAELEEKLSAMVSPDEPSPIKKVDPSPIKKVKSYENSPVHSMAEKLRSVRSLDGQAPAAMPSRQLLEVRSFDDDSAASSKVSAFTDVLAGSAGAVAAAVGAAVTALSFGEEKKETDSVASLGTKTAPEPEIRRVKSADTLFTDLSNPTQPGRIRTHGERPASPSGMVSVDSASIYIEEQSSASEIGGSESLLSAPLSAARSRSQPDSLLPDPEESLSPKSAVEDALSGSGSGHETDAGTIRSDCPEDEGQGVLRPGSAYLSRHQGKKSNESTIPDEPPVKADRTRPIYKGVSVRPSTRSRAGIFSRRQPQLATFTDDEGDSDGSGQRQKLPINLGPKRSERLKAQRSVSPNNSTSTSEESPPKFTTANYYVEEPDDRKLHESLVGDEDPNLTTEQKPTRRRSKAKRRQKQAATNGVAAPNTTESPASEAWNSFLSELTKVESTFFGSNTFMSTGESTNEEAARPVEAGSDDESAQPPPKPPRTFYA